MRLADGSSQGTAARLRLDFDQAFSAPAGAARGTTEDFLALRVAGQAYALRLAAISGLFVDRPVTPLPGSDPRLLGIAGLRGSLVALYDLAALLGHPRSEKPRWAVLAAQDRTLGLVFAELEGFLRLSSADLATSPVAAGAGTLREAARAGGILRPIIDVPALVEVVRRSIRQAGSHEER